MEFWELMWFFFIVVPITIAWFAAIIDLFQRPDLNGWAKAAWFLAVLVVPIIGTLIYLLTRPATVGTRTMGAYGYNYAPTPVGDMGTVSELEVLSRLRTEGALSQEEFDAAKSRVLTSKAA